MPKISQYGSGSPPQVGDQIIIARGGANYSLTFAQLFQNIPSRISVGGTDSGLAGRSTFSANSEAFAIAVRYAPAGGPVYFGAKSASATPDAAISNAGGSPIVTFENARRVYLDGGQIGFPSAQISSADPNTLDDYEEGSYTPSVAPQAGSITSYTSTGRYTKIGNTQTGRANVSYANIGTATGYATVGLPFSNAADTTTAQGAFNGAEYGTTGFAVCGYVFSASTFLYRKYDASSPLVNGQAHTITFVTG